MRPASVEWEPLSLDGSAACHGWAWFRPPAVTQGVICRLADGVTATLRGLAVATGIDPGSVSLWVVFGTPCPGPSAGAPATMLDQPLVPPPGAPDSNIAIHVAAVAAVAALPVSSAGSGGVVDEVVYTAIEAHWFGIQAETVKIDMLRKQVDSMLGQLKTLNRDLNFEEKEFSTRQDKDAWDDARRWMRNASLQLSRCQKACDVGDTQSVGKREWLQDIHDRFIAVRQPIENPNGVEGEFAYFRKLQLNLETQVNAALSSAGTDAMGRGRRVLAEIAVKIRKARSG
jgi:hypothetical protein